jgi:hypothetical protein
MEIPMSAGNEGHELGSPPGTPLPEGVFPVKSGPPTVHPMAEEFRRRGPEWLYRWCRQEGLNEQSTYSHLRSFFRFTFKDFKALARRADRAGSVTGADSQHD